LGIWTDSKCDDNSGCSHIENTASRINVVAIISMTNTPMYPNMNDPKTPWMNDDVISIVDVLLLEERAADRCFVVAVIADVFLTIRADQSMTSQPYPMSGGMMTQDTNPTWS
jgi:hypothetical protein